MPITFTRAPVVSAGRAVLSRDIAAQALAFEDRMLAPLGDAPWRISHFCFSPWRQLRNPDSSGFVFPPQGEFFDLLGAIDPDYSTLEVATADPGFPEGVNLANRIAAFISGDPSNYSEADRLADLPMMAPDGDPPATPLEYWQLGFMQRGARDPITGAEAWPAGEAAQSGFRWASSWWSWHGKAYGSIQPTPEIGYTAAVVTGDCGDTPDEGQGLVNYLYKFTATREDVTAPAGHHANATTEDGKVVLTYKGSCPCWTALVDDEHVQYVYRGKFAYHVYTSIGGTCETNEDILPRADWVEGLYTGTGRLTMTEADHIERFMQAYVTDFRGTPAQRDPDDFDIEKIAFDHQKHGRRQYALAPAYGVESGGLIAQVIPTMKWSGVTMVMGGTTSIWNTSGPEYQCHDGFVIAGACLYASGLETPATVEIFIDGVSVKRLTVTPDAAGVGSAISWMARARSGEVTVKTVGDFRLAAGGVVHLELAELVDYKPQLWDTYLVLRMTTGVPGPRVDGRGLDYATAQTVSRNFLARGCIVNDQGLFGPPDPGAAINWHPLYDAARRVTNSCVRILNRRQFAGYEVADGKSIVYLKRFAYGLETDRVDLLAGIAPPIDAVASGSLLEGETYVVEASGDGGVTYNGTMVRNGETFTAVSETNYTPQGDAVVYVWNGIRERALRKGWSNRWCSFTELKCSHPSESSLFKTSAYTDYFTFIDRCTFAGGDIDQRLARHIGLNHRVELDDDNRPILHDMRAQADLLATENPPGYRTLYGSNNPIYNGDFRPSCQLYDPAIKIESVTVHDRAAGIVKVTFEKRFLSHPDAPATWSATAPTWAMEDAKPTEVVDLDTEVAGAGGYRTLDNGYRAAHVKLANAHYECPFAAAGDSGVGSGISTNPDDPFGACNPTIHFVSIPNAPWDDGNDAMDDLDTRVTVDEMVKRSIYLRAMCEGWIDAQATSEVMCSYANDGSLFDFSYTSMLMQATGRATMPWIGGKARTDAPEGYGPFPNTVLYADTFNTISQCVNILTKCRIPLPVNWESRVLTWTDVRSADPQPDPCSTTSTIGSWIDSLAAPTPGGTPADTGWVIDNPEGTIASWNSVLIGCPWEQQTIRKQFSVRATLTGSWAEFLPDALAEHITELGMGFAGRLDYFVRHYKRRVVSSGSSTWCGAVGSGCQPFSDDSGYQEFVIHDDPPPSECRLITPGETFVPEVPPQGDYWIGNCSGSGAGFCAGGAAWEVALTPFETFDAFAEAQLVDPE